MVKGLTASHFVSRCVGRSETTAINPGFLLRMCGSATATTRPPPHRRYHPPRRPSFLLRAGRRRECLRCRNGARQQLTRPKQARNGCGPETDAAWWPRPSATVAISAAIPPGSKPFRSRRRISIAGSATTNLPARLSPRSPASVPEKAPRTRDRMRRALDRLLAIVARLHDSERDCPCAREENWRRFTPYAIEEAYEPPTQSAQRHGRVEGGVGPPAATCSAALV